MPSRVTVIPVLTTHVVKQTLYGVMSIKSSKNKVLSIIFRILKILSYVVKKFTVFCLRLYENC